VFGIPGAKINKVFDAPLNFNIKAIVCRHEYNAGTRFVSGTCQMQDGEGDIKI
jgi:hypothetical protein